MSTVRLYQPKPKIFRTERKDGRVKREIRITPGVPPSTGTGPEGTFAYLEPHVVSVLEYRRRRGHGARAFDLWTDPDRGRLIAQVVTKTAVKRRRAVFEVLDGEGGHLALITREHPLKEGWTRARWTVEQVGQQPAVGVKGTLFWWYVWWICFPLLFLILFCSDGSVSVRAPYRTRWSVGHRRVLDWGRFGLRVSDTSWDPRVVSALLALLTSHEGFFGSPWDEQWTIHEGPG